jgi:hypothetical protein
MATSIRDLVYALEGEAPYEAGTNRQSRDAAGALSELGRALRRLATDGLELEVQGRRENIVRDLAESCAQNAATIELDRSGRLTGLAGGLADVVGVLGQETGRDQRWAIAVEVASAARVLTTYAAEGDGRRTADLAWTHLTARALIVQALQDTPSVHSRAILDQAVPRMMLPPDLPAARAALESLTVISDRLRRSAAELGRRPTLLEVFAVTRAAESTTRYATTTAAVLAGAPLPDARPAAAIWYEVRDRLQPFTSAAPLHLENRDLGLWAQRAHSELRREFGSAEQPRLTRDGGAGQKIEALRHLQSMVNEIPAIADHLAIAVQQLADHGDLHALATRLPFREQRLDQFIARRAVIADRFDVVSIMDRLGDAAKLAAELATTLDRAGGPVDRPLQPDLLAAHAARAAQLPPDPHGPLAEHVRDGMQGACGADPGMLEVSAPPAEVLRGDVDDADYQSAPDWDVE